MNELNQTYTDLRRKEAWLHAILKSAAEVSILSRSVPRPPDAAHEILDLPEISDLGRAPRLQAEVVRRARARLLALVNDILDLSTIESGHFQLEHIEFDLRAVISRTFEIIDPDARAKNLTLKLLVALDTPRLLIGDPGRLQQLLGKLLGNVIDSAKGGEITLAATVDPADKNHLNFELAASPTGVLNNSLGSICDDFTEEESGLDLVFCRRLLPVMGGTLRPCSQREKGSLLAFDIRFASILQEGNVAEPATSLVACGVPVADQNCTSPAVPTRLMRVLIAEDSDDSRFLLQEFLRKGPYALTFAENGKLAFEAAALYSFDLILMDIQMPVMDGLTATRLIRKAEREAGRAPTPLLALTSNARKVDIELSRAAGCTAHVLKPISRQELMNTMLKYAPVQAAPEPASIPVVNIPPGLEEAAKRYITSRKNDVPRLTHLVQTKEFEQLRILAHDMKGTGTSYGFVDLSRLGALMERSAREQNEPALSNQLLELRRYVHEAADMVAAFSESRQS